MIKGKVLHVGEGGVVANPKATRLDSKVPRCTAGAGRRPSRDTARTLRRARRPMPTRSSPRGARSRGGRCAASASAAPAPRRPRVCRTCSSASSVNWPSPTYARIRPAVVGRDARVRQRPARRAALERAVGVLLAQGAAEDRRGGDLDVRQERLRPVAAVEEDALVVVVAVVVVPVDERARRSDASCIAYIVSTPVTSTSHALGMSFSLIMLMIVQKLKP